MAGGWAFSEQNHIPTRLAVPATLAIAFELCLYLTLAFTRIRQRWTPLWLILAAPLPLCLYAIPSGLLAARQLVTLLLLVAVAALWFRILPRGYAADFGFVALAAAPVLFKLFPRLYPEPMDRMDMAIAGQLLWIRVTACAVLNDRRPAGVNFGFLPTLREWGTGAGVFLLSLGPVLAANHALGFARLGLSDAPAWRIALGAVGTFWGILWVVALSEELFFRGLLQPWLSDLLKSKWAGLGVTALLFGAAHLGFRGFPNFRFSALAAVAGVAYGLAYERGQGVRAAMVAHALLVTLWRTVFR